MVLRCWSSSLTNLFDDLIGIEPGNQQAQDKPNANAEIGETGLAFVEAIVGHENVGECGEEQIHVGVVHGDIECHQGNNWRTEKHLGRPDNGMDKYLEGSGSAVEFGMQIRVACFFAQLRSPTDQKHWTVRFADEEEACNGQETGLCNLVSGC